MQDRFGRRLAWALVTGFLLVSAGVVGRAVMIANEAADRSAQLALTQEIFDKLRAFPAGEPYPESLEELKLTYPDGGDSKLLDRFTYRSDGKSCTVSTTIAGEVKTVTFPESPERPSASD